MKQATAIQSTQSRSCRFANVTFIFILAIALIVTTRAADAPTNAPSASPTPPPSSPAKKSAAELEKLAMPIALHPDPLIAIILPASVYPVEVIMAARFVQDTNNIAKLDSQPWDDSVKAVARFPELIKKMSDDLEWTVALGQAFLDQRKELMDTVQALRLKAQKAGTLKTSPQQVVTVTNSIVEKVVEQQTVVVTNTIVQIEPANPEVIYVPSYPPTVYYPPPAYAYGYAYYGYGYYPYAPLVTFGVGMMWGAAISGWHHHHCDWHGGDVNIDRNTNIDRGDRNRGDRAEQRGDRAGDRSGNRAADRSGNRAADRAGGGQQKWQADQNRLRNSGAPTAKARESRGFQNSSANVASQLKAAETRARASTGARPSTGAAAGARPAQRPAGGGATQRPAGAGQRPAAAQRPAGAGQSVNRSVSQRSSAFSGVNNGGGSTRNYSNRGSSSRGGGGYSGGSRGGGGGRGGGGRGGGGRR
jgi:hypothetical protein